MDLRESLLSSSITESWQCFQFKYVYHIDAEHMSNQLKLIDGTAIYTDDATLHPACKTKPNDDSYPSGHAATGYLTGLALVDIVLENRDAILARAEEYAASRLICRAHDPREIFASRLVAYASHAIMALHPGYKTELAAARTELRAALGLPAIQ